MLFHAVRISALASSTCNRSINLARWANERSFKRIMPTKDSELQGIQVFGMLHLRPIGYPKIGKYEPLIDYVCSTFWQARSRGNVVSRSMRATEASNCSRAKLRSSPNGNIGAQQATTVSLRQLIRHRMRKSLGYRGFLGHGRLVTGAASIVVASFV